MVHNGIEYGLMQAYAEGFDILRNAGSQTLPEEHRFSLDIADIAEGLAPRQRRLVVAARSPGARPGRGSDACALHRQRRRFGRRPLDHQCRDHEAVPADVLSAALYARFRSRQEHTFGEKLLSAMRFQFGGHKEK